MLTFISCAKTMTNKGMQAPFHTNPVFLDEVHKQVHRMAALNMEDMAKLLHINTKLAAQNVIRYQDFFSKTNLSLPALLSYTGMVFKHIAPNSFTNEDFRFAHDYLRITSFLYGLLRPMDLIKNYRLEGNIPYSTTERESIFKHWQPILTPHFIQDIQNKEGILVNLASGEMKELFHWNKIEESVHVITPEFFILKDGKPKVVTVYAKKCRGEMVRFIIKNRINDPEKLKDFTWEGFSYNPDLSTDNHWAFCL